MEALPSSLSSANIILYDIARIGSPLSLSFLMENGGMELIQIAKVRFRFNCVLLWILIHMSRLSIASSPWLQGLSLFLASVQSANPV